MLDINTKAFPRLVDGKPVGNLTPMEVCEMAARDPKPFDEKQLVAMVRWLGSQPGDHAAHVRMNILAHFETEL